MEAAGVDAIGVDGRSIADRTEVTPARWDDLTVLPSSLTIPVLANGDIIKREDIAAVKAATGCSSVLIARGALLNPSIFRAQGVLPITQVQSLFSHVSTKTSKRVFYDSHCCDVSYYCDL